MAIDIRLYFDCTNKKTFVKDLTDYSTEIPNGVTVDGIGTLLSPSQNLIINRPIPPTPIIAYNASPRVSALYNLTSPIQAGQYTFNYSNFYSYITNIADDQYVTILANNTIMVTGEIASLFSIGDEFAINNSEDSENNGIYNVLTIENSFGNTIITISGTNLVPKDPIAADDTANLSITKTVSIYTDKVYTYSTCISTPTACVEFSYDCFTGAYGIGQITDTTDYTGYTIESRTLTAYYPNALSPAPAENPVSTSNAIININALATGTWSAKVSSVVSKVQEDGLVVQSTASTLKEFNVSCSSNMCGLSDCLTKLKDKHISYLKSSNISPLQQYVDNVQLLYTMAKEAQACGDKNAYSDYVSQIYEVLKKTESDCGCSTSSSCSCGCESDGSCGCGDQTPQWVDNVGIDLNSLLEEFTTFMNDTLPTILADIDALQNDMSQAQSNIVDLQAEVTALNTGLAAVTVQSGNNTISIDELDAQINTPVTGLAAQVEQLQNEISNLSVCDSEVSLNELFNNLPTTQQGVWKATNGEAISNVLYEITIPGNQTSYLTVGKYASFFSVPTQSWFYGPITYSQYSGLNTVIQLYFGAGGTAGCTFEEYNGDFPVYISTNQSDVATYDFTKLFSLNNADFWKNSDSNYKYWSKINVVFACNDVTNVYLLNENTGLEFQLRTNPGTFVELEMTFEKQWMGSAYNLAISADAKYSGNLSSSEVVDGDLYNDGFYGYIPSLDNGINLNNASALSFFGINSTTGQPGCVLTQDVYDKGGLQTSNRELMRYAYGPSYPSNTDSIFFTGNQNDDITFNAYNANITVFKFEQSFGRFAI